MAKPKYKKVRLLKLMADLRFRNAVLGLGICSSGVTLAANLIGRYSFASNRTEKAIDLALSAFAWSVYRSWPLWLAGWLLFCLGLFTALHFWPPYRRLLRGVKYFTLIPLTWMLGQGIHALLIAASYLSR